jgi:hypothetical protein
MHGEVLMKNCEKHQDHQIQETLKISFHALDDDRLKNIFLDIACFFVGRNKEYVSINDSYKLHYVQNELRMHDLVRDMRREIVCQAYFLLPGGRSRIWLHEEAWKVLEMNTVRTKCIAAVLCDRITK